MLGFSISCHCAWGTLTKHPRYQHSLEDLFLQVYVWVDDWLKANELQFALPKQRSQIASYTQRALTQPSCSR